MRRNNAAVRSCDTFARLEGLEDRRMMSVDEAAIILPPPEEVVASVQILTPVESESGVPEIVINIDPGQDIGIAEKPAKPAKPKDPQPFLIVKVQDVMVSSL